MHIALTRANNAEPYRASLKAIVQEVLQKTFRRVKFDDTVRTSVHPLFSLKKEQKESSDIPH